MEKRSLKVYKIRRNNPISNKIKNIILKRDNGRCVVCGETENLQLAHILAFATKFITEINKTKYPFPEQITDLISQLNAPENLIILCKKCHKLYDHRKILSREDKEYIENQIIHYIKEKNLGINIKLKAYYHFTYEEAFNWWRAILLDIKGFRQWYLREPKGERRELLKALLKHKTKIPERLTFLKVRKFYPFLKHRKK